MNDAEEKRLSQERSDLMAYLDKRIPELQAMGKPPAPDKSLPLEERVDQVRKALAGSKYPGRAAREKAEQEFAAGARA